MCQSKVPIVVCSKAYYQAGQEYFGQFKHSAVWWVFWYYLKLRARQKQRDVDTIDIMLKCMHILIGVSTVNKIFWCNNNWLIMNYIRCTCWGAGWKCARHCKHLFAALRSNFAKSPWEHFITKKYVWHCKQHLFLRNWEPLLPKVFENILSNAEVGAGPWSYKPVDFSQGCLR